MLRVALQYPERFVPEPIPREIETATDVLLWIDALADRIASVEFKETFSKRLPEMLLCWARRIVAFGGLGCIDKSAAVALILVRLSPAAP